MHHRLEALVVKAEQLLGRFDDNSQLIVILATIDAGSVRGGTNLDHQDRRLRKGWDFHDSIVVHQQDARS